MKIAVEGCAHGELEKIYETLQHLEKQEGIKVDLLICCGDFQATRNMQDLSCMAVSQKYRDMCTFYKYYSGEKRAPVLTVFIGGNHEASNHLQELGYGGWAAPNIYYLGYAGVVTIGGIRIAGLSGIYKGRDYMRGRYERVPYSEDTKRSVYHIRNLDVFRLKQLSKPVDVMLSHDWPRGVTEYGDASKLLQKKPFFKKDIEENVLGSKPAEELLHDLQPTYWFSAHLHCKFPALVPHGPRKGVTKFLALDKCLPRRKFLQIVDIDHDSEKSLELCYDLEWLAILHSTNHLLSVKKGLTYMPGRSDHERWIYTPTEEEKEFVHKRFNNDLKIPENFTQSVTAYSPNSPGTCTQPSLQLNPQTVTFCQRLGVDDPLVLLQESSSLDGTLSPFSLPSCLTPDRSYDTSQVSFTADENEALNSSDEDVKRLNSSASSAGKRFSMSLPPPKLSFGEEEDFIPLSDSQEQSLSSKSSHSQEQDQEPSLSSKSPHSQEQEPSLSSKSPHSQEHEPFLSSKSYQLSEESPAVSDIPLSESTTPTLQNEDCRPQKKFKRRNQSLYASTEDD